MNQYPLTLPGPSKILLKPAERRRVSSLSEGLQQVLGRQRDFLGVEEVEWEFVASYAEIFDTWWKDELVYGGGWFSAGWPSSRLLTGGNRRFITVPKWTLIGHEYWRVSADLELRGGAVPMEPGGTRPYDMYASFPSQAGNNRLMYGGFSELTYPWTLHVTTHNTAVDIAAGPVVEFTFTVVNVDTVNFSAPSFSPVTSTTTRTVSLRDFDTNSATIRALNTLPGNFYTTQTITVHATVDGVDIGQAFQLICNPDETTNSGTAVVTGYPGGRTTYADYTWSTF